MLSSISEAYTAIRNDFEIRQAFIDLCLQAVPLAAKEASGREEYDDELLREIFNDLASSSDTTDLGQNQRDKAQAVVYDLHADQHKSGRNKQGGYSGSTENVVDRIRFHDRAIRKSSELWYPDTR